MPELNIKINDNSGDILKELERKKEMILESIGITAEGYAKLKTPVNTGRLRNSMTHTVKGNEVYIGTNLSYAPWVEVGTGIYATDGQGRKSPWSYKDSKGKWHRTKGMKPKHMLRDAVSQHTDEYKAIIENIMKK